MENLNNRLYLHYRLYLNTTHFNTELITYSKDCSPLIIFRELGLRWDLDIGSVRQHRAVVDVLAPAGCRGSYTSAWSTRAARCSRPAPSCRAATIIIFGQGHLPYKTIFNADTPFDHLKS